MVAVELGTRHLPRGCNLDLYQKMPASNGGEMELIPCETQECILVVRHVVINVTEGESIFQSATEGT